MRLFDEINLVLEDNVIPGEVVLEDLFNNTSLYYMNVKGQILFLNKIKDISVDESVIGLAFVKNSCLYFFCVKKDHQNRGRATAFLRAIVKREQHLRLKVRSQNESAKAVYQKVGFREIDISPNYYSYTAILDDAINMQYP